MPRLRARTPPRRRDGPGLRDAARRRRRPRPGKAPRRPLRGPPDRALRRQRVLGALRRSGARGGPSSTISPARRCVASTASIAARAGCRAARRSRDAGVVGDARVRRAHRRRDRHRHRRARDPVRGLSDARRRRAAPRLALHRFRCRSATWRPATWRSATACAGRTSATCSACALGRPGDRRGGAR